MCLGTYMYLQTTKELDTGKIWQMLSCTTYTTYLG